ncbi:MAG TPA: flagellar biosynthesis protein FlgD [Janthinobacterium sp.]|nr:flagellar biosynthesis protein FlgD [Janthinobacterium sp.]
MTAISNNSTGISTDLMATVNPKKAAAGDTSVADDTNKFLTLLVTQMQNQDPMNPLDNAQLTSQLAQLSTVTGVNQLNTTLTSLMGSYQNSESVQAAGMIGHGVLTPGSGISLASGKSVYGVNLTTAADDVQVVIKDSAGKAVRSIDLGAQAAGSLPLAWDGKTDSLTGSGAGPVAADGQYTFSVVATRAGAALKDAAGLTLGVVASVSTGAAGVKLNVSGVGSVSMADIKQIL